MAKKKLGPMEEFLTIRRHQGRHAFGTWVPPALPIIPSSVPYTPPTTNPSMSSIPAKRSAPLNENEKAAELRRRAEAVRARMSAEQKKAAITTPAAPQQNGSNMSPAEVGRARAAAVIAKFNRDVSATTPHAPSPSSSTPSTPATEPKPTSTPAEIQSTVDSAKARIAAAMAKRQGGTTPA